MKLVTFLHPAVPGARTGVLDAGGHTIVDLLGLASSVGVQLDFARDMQSLIEAGEPGLAQVRNLVDSGRPQSRFPLEESCLLAPLPVPGSLRCFSVFEQHARQSTVMARALASGRFRPGACDPEAAAEVSLPVSYFERPLYYKGNRFSVVGHGTAVTWPEYSQMIDYELEIAAVIGRRGRDIPRETASAHIFGYCLWNDLTARDEQLAEMSESPLGPAKSKDFDGGNVMGPCLVTADELPDPYALDLMGRVNGEVWSQGNSGGMVHSFEDMIAYVSRAETLYPGEVFLSGCIGNGSGLELGRWLKRGDTIELEAEGVGVLSTCIR